MNLLLIKWKTLSVIILFLTFFFLSACSQNKQATKYVFYLHGGIVQQQGANAISPEFGPYEYNNIVQALRDKGFNVISEVRPKTATEMAYATKVSDQIDSLMAIGIRAEDITILGASLGGYIAMEVAYKQNNSKLNYAVLGLCGAYALEHFETYTIPLCGNFLSIYEQSDSRGSCGAMLEKRTCITGVKEIELTMGNGHGFLYKPYDEWMLPLTDWIMTIK